MPRLRRLLAALCTVVLLSTGPAAAALPVPGPTIHSVDVYSVPTGPRPHVDYLTGRLLHTASGRMIPLPWPIRYQDSLELLGRGPDGWIVVYHHTARIFEVDRDGRAHLLFHYLQDQGYEGYSVVTLSTNHQLIAIRAAGQGGAFYTVYDLAGFVVGYRSWENGTLVAFRGRSIYFSRSVGLTHTRLVRWTMGRVPIDTGLRDVTLLDLAHHQFLRDVYAAPRYRDELATLPQPGTVRWSLCTDCHGQDLIARGFSPDGTKLAYFHGSSTGAPVEGETIRATSDGHVVTDLRFDARVWAQRWEDSLHLLVEVVDRQAGQSLYQAQKAVLRCGLGGRCTRVTTWQHHFILDYEPPGGL